jgi:aryl-alcohol dehydrogenase-like predicted oxidoreductase
MHNWDKFTPIDETMRALDDLVRSGKVRYIGFSDTPAWKVTQAQMLAQFHGWAPLVALQIEYSLLERTVEGELIPMAIEMGLGVTPWSPLKNGALSGKYTRENVNAVKPDRGEGVTSTLAASISWSRTLPRSTSTSRPRKPPRSTSCRSRR